jgi:hypothetical protein
MRTILLSLFLVHCFGRYNGEIENVKQWAKHNKFLINTSKSEEIVLHRQTNSRIVDQPCIVCGIQQVAEVKLL